jgi:hypothetical protein
MVVDLLGFPANLLTEELESLRFPVDRLYFPPNRPDKLDIRLLICWVVGAFFHGAIYLTFTPTWCWGGTWPVQR